MSIYDRYKELERTDAEVAQFAALWGSFLTASLHKSPLVNEYRQILRMFGAPDAELDAAASKAIAAFESAGVDP